MVQIPHKVPKNGFYYHYKHDPEGSINNYAYEVLGVGCHTEDVYLLVVYRPLYESSVYKAGKLFDLRPLEMWMGEVAVNGKTVPRFRKITDPDVVEKLREIRQEKYGMDTP